MGGRRLGQGQVAATWGQWGWEEEARATPTAGSQPRVGSGGNALVGTSLLWVSEPGEVPTPAWLAGPGGWARATLCDWRPGAGTLIC